MEPSLAIFNVDTSFSPLKEERHFVSDRHEDGLYLLA
jgi:hypothetical protein